MRKILIDTDPGIDDALAILLAAAASEELEIMGLTTVNGNVGIDKVTGNACRILDLAKRNDIPVYRGHEKPLFRERENCEEFHGDDGLGNLEQGCEIDCSGYVKEEHAVDVLLRTSVEAQGVLTLVAIGPLTNVADAVRKDPEFASRIHELVIMGGAEHGGNMSPHAEFNFWTDPEAAKIVFEAGFPNVIMVGLDATSYVFLTPDLRELLYQINSPISRFMHKITRIYADGHWALEHKLGCELCDVLTIAYLLDSSVVETVDAFVDVETKGLCDGASVVYRLASYPDKVKNCRVAVKADTKQFFRLFFRYQFPEYEEIAVSLMKEN